MTIALVLFGYAALLGVAAPWLLRRGWADHAPRLAVAAWQAVTATVVVAVALGALALAVPTAPFSGNLAHLLEACVLALRSRYATPGGAAMASAGAMLGLAVIARCAYCAVAELTKAARQRRRHRDAPAELNANDHGPWAIDGKPVAATTTLTGTSRGETPGARTPGGEDAPVDVAITVALSDGKAAVGSAGAGARGAAGTAAGERGSVRHGPCPRL
ncbi:hypothetical protein [Actinomadura sp. 3N407]|uniref:hypothetical protein n=1 Tax=Actinomadura sp. 3N407 TaxID=3457423 RepID=UPI003FCE95AD